MERFLKIVAACVMASLCLSVPAAEKPKAKAIDYSKAITVVITEQMTADLLRFMQLRRTLLVPVKEACSYQTGGVCPIEIPVVLLQDPADATKQYCVAVFPEVVKLPGAGAGSIEKTVVWSLKPKSPPPPGVTFTFYSEKDHGIILLKNGSNQMHSGTHGDGTATQPDKTKYLFKNKHKVQGAQAVYLPIVVRTDNAGTPTEKVSVCGTPDPLIENIP
jgi:hypothetical protein